LDYCAESDLYQFGVPRGRTPNPGRLAAGANIATNAIELDDHCFSAGDVVTFRAEAGGVLPSPLAEGVQYAVEPLTDAAFRVLAPITGGPIDIATVGSGVIVIAPLSKGAAISWASGIIDDMVPAHVLPLAASLATVPPIVRMTCAELAAGKLVGFGGPVPKTLGDAIDAAQKRIDRWSKGVAIRGTNAPAAADLSQSTVIAPDDARGWARYGGIT
jgi:hypothetical protein